MSENKDKYKSLKIAVSADFKDVFSHFYYAENKSSELISKTLLPSFQSILIFNFGERVSLHLKKGNEFQMDKYFFFGPIKKAFDYSLPPNSEILVVNFKHDAFYRLFGKANTIDFLPENSDDILNGNHYEELWRELNRMNNLNHRINRILGFCNSYLNESNTIAEEFANLDNKNINLIKHLAVQQNLTERTIQLHHRRLLGYTFKELSRYKRFLKAINLIQSKTSTSTRMDWFEIINICGYYDQSQFIHDFNHYLNTSPTQYLKNKQAICSAIPEVA